MQLLFNEVLKFLRRVYLKIEKKNRDSFSLTLKITLLGTQYSYILKAIKIFEVNISEKGKPYVAIH